PLLEDGRQSLDFTGHDIGWVPCSAAPCMALHYTALRERKLPTLAHYGHAVSLRGHDDSPSGGQSGMDSGRSFSAHLGRGGGHNRWRASVTNQRVESGDVCVNHLAQALELRCNTAREVIEDLPRLAGGCCLAAGNDCGKRGHLGVEL